MPRWVLASTSYTFGFVGAVCCIMVFFSAIPTLLFAITVLCQVPEFVALEALCDVKFRRVFLWVEEFSLDRYSTFQAHVCLFHTICKDDD